MRASVAVGVTAVLFGLVVLAQRGLAGLLQLNYAFVTLVGVLALVQGLRFASESRGVDRRAAETLDVEQRYQTPVPGDDVDALVADPGGVSGVSIKRRREFHARLADAARETLRARGDYGVSDVDDAIDEGTWTADPVAAWFLGDDRVSPPISVRARGVLGSGPEFRFAAVRTIAALAALQEGENTVESADRSGRPVVAAVRDAARRRIRGIRDRFVGGRG